MNNIMLQKILSAYAIDEPSQILAFGTGLINGTWKISDRSGEFILQKINQQVFTEPQKIADNIESIASYLRKVHPGYFFPSPVKTVSGEEMVIVEKQDYFRLFPFVEGSSTIDVVDKLEHAFEAARQFGRFTGLLSDFPVSNLEITLPDFHNLSLRYAQFKTALKTGNSARIKESAKEIDFIAEHADIVTRFERLSENPSFKKRVTHHDTKISNVLFDKTGKGICVIDLDTIMPGYFISDFGDMMRTYLSPVSEEEKDFSKIEIREDYFSATLQGYLQEMLSKFSEDETRHLVYAGMFMTYMQAMRFLTDYINNDHYYGAKYETHNYVRAANQINLLKSILDKELRLEQIVTDQIARIRSGT